MIGKVVVFGIIGVIGYALLKGYDYYRRLAYRFVGYEIKDITINEQPTVNVGLKFQIYNPTPVILTVNSIQGSIYVNNYYIGNVDNQIEQIIYSDSVSSVDLNVIAYVKKVSTVVIGELLGQQFSKLNVRFVGNITVENIPVKVNIDSTL